MKDAATMKRVEISGHTAMLLARMGLAYPVGSEERAAATLLLTKFERAPERVQLAEVPAAA